MHLVLQRTSWDPTPVPQVECFSNLSLGNGCTRNELRDLLRGNRLQQLRKNSSTDVFRRSIKKNNNKLLWTMNMKLVATGAFQHITHDSSSRHDSPTTIRMHSVVCLVFPCTEKLSGQIRQHSTWTGRSTVPWDFHHNCTLLRQHQFCCESGTMWLVAMSPRLMT